MRTAAAERVLHQRLHEACEANIYLDGPQASLTVVFKGKAMVSRRNGTVSGGHVYALVHHGNHHDPGVFECTVEPGGQSLPASETTSKVAQTMAGQPAELRRILADWEPIEAAAARLRGRRVFLVGTGTSWHAANQGAFFLRLAGVDAPAVAAADCALWGPRPTSSDALILLSHRGTKRYTSEVLERARAEGVAAVAIGGVGAPGVDIETVPQETSPTFTASHLGALSRLAQLAVALGAQLGPLEAVPEAVAGALEAPTPTVAPPERGLEFVGAGPNQWTAAEGALKVREAARLFASGYSLEQLRHGPGFALGPADALLCLDGGGPAAERLSEVAAAVAAHGAFVYRFAAPELGEPLSIFPLSAFVQRVACELAVQVGSDPDDVSSAKWNAIAL